MAGYVALGKYDNEWEDVLHYLCQNGWANESTGNVEAPSGYVWRISNDWESVKPENGEFNSLMEEWFEQNDVEDSEEFRRALVGHFIVREDNNGLVFLQSFKTEQEMLDAYAKYELDFSEWGTEDED
jgi:hypothetical protein